MGYLLSTWESIKETDPATYWKYMYESERRKHYNKHHRTNSNKGQDGVALHDACHTFEIDCVKTIDDSSPQIFSKEDIVDEIGKKMAEDLEKQVKEDWKKGE